MSYVREDNSELLPGCHGCNSCGSSDAVRYYVDGGAYCFSCNTYNPNGDAGKATDKHEGHRTMAGNLIQDVDPVTLVARKINEQTCRHMGYGNAHYKRKPVQVANYYNTDGQVVAQKVRDKDKNFVFIGNTKEALMFNQQNCRGNGRKLTITEGEIDALSVSQAFDNKWDVVSISSGASGARREIAKHLEFISGYDEIVLWFDNDRAGREALDSVIPILPIGKVKIARHVDYKDANDVLKHLGKAGVVNTFYNAEMFKPEGIILPEELLEEALKPIEYGRPWMFEKMTDITYGRRLGEVVALGAGVSVGKTDFVMQSISDDMKRGYKVGTFMLEQQTRETLLRIAGKIDGQHYHLPDSEHNPEDLRTTITNIKDLYIYDNFGAIDWETISNKIKFMVHNYGVEHIYIDNLTALNAHAQDERRNLDALMADVAALAKELNIWILVVSHLNPPKTGNAHEAGGRVEQAQFTGSRAIMRWSSFMLGVERNTIHDDPEERQKGLVRCIKDRFSGKATGKTIGFIYDTDTGILMESDEIQQVDLINDEEDY